MTPGEIDKAAQGIVDNIEFPDMIEGQTFWEIPGLGTFEHIHEKDTDKKIT